MKFPCQIKFVIHPYSGMPRSAVYPCKDQGELDQRVDFYLSDATGNTQRVVHSVYTPPERGQRETTS